MLGMTRSKSFGQQWDEVVEPQERVGPAVYQQQWWPAFGSRPYVVQPHPVYGGPVVVEGVDPCLGRSPVKPAAPVLDQFLEHARRGAPLPVIGHGVGEARPGETGVEVVQYVLRDLDGEDGVVRQVDHHHFPFHAAPEEFSLVLFAVSLWPPHDGVRPVDGVCHFTPLEAPRTFADRHTRPRPDTVSS
jgi:hypothetical protein